MIDKQKILDHVEFYSADELVAYIQQGVVTLDELISETDGDLMRPSVKLSNKSWKQVIRMHGNLHKKQIQLMRYRIIWTHIRMDNSEMKQEH